MLRNFTQGYFNYCLREKKENKTEHKNNSSRFLPNKEENTGLKKNMLIYETEWV